MPDAAIVGRRAATEAPGRERVRQEVPRALGFLVHPHLPAAPFVLGLSVCAVRRRPRPLAHRQQGVCMYTSAASATTRSADWIRARAFRRSREGRKTGPRGKGAIPPFRGGEAAIRSRAGGHAGGQCQPPHHAGPSVPPLATQARGDATDVLRPRRGGGARKPC